MQPHDLLSYSQKSANDPYRDSDILTLFFCKIHFNIVSSEALTAAKGFM
jgi:hypothetical protein